MKDNQAITIQDIQSKLGHKNSEMTKKYLENLSKDIDASIEKATKLSKAFDKKGDTGN